VENLNEFKALILRSEMTSLKHQLQKIEQEKREIISKIKKEIKNKRGDLHDWEYISVHHGWTFWYQCKLCGKYSSEDRDLSNELKKEKCNFFDVDFIPNNLLKYD
jgi:hypothetical protein